jgi:hypothetical protein
VVDTGIARTQLQSALNGAMTSNTSSELFPS